MDILDEQAHDNNDHECTISICSVKLYAIQYTSDFCVKVMGVNSNSNQNKECNIEEMFLNKIIIVRSCASYMRVCWSQIQQLNDAAYCKQQTTLID